MEGAEFLTIIFKERPGVNLRFFNYKIRLKIVESARVWVREKRVFDHFMFVLFSYPLLPTVAVFTGHPEWPDV